MTCRANTGPVERTTPVLFEPDESNPWPSGLEITETLLTVKKGKSIEVEIDIVNSTNHDIRLPGQTLLGRLQLVQSVTPVEVRLKDSNEKQKLLIRLQHVLETPEAHRLYPHQLKNL